MPASSVIASTRAVVLSCAPPDAGAARRIGEALREAGFEVWFGQVGSPGEAPEPLVRQRIQECALFMPIVSPHTKASPREEFRREWRLADERARLMERQTPFIIPVAIDGERDADAHYPESFHKAPWLRWVEGEAPASFCARLGALLEEGGTGAARRATHPPGATPVRDQAAPPRRPGEVRRWIGPGAAVLLLVALVSVQPWRQARRDLAESGTEAGIGAGIGGAGAAPENSIAVLPLVDLGDRPGEDFLTDGLSEEVIDRLARIPNLDVAGRASSFSFKGANQNIPVIEQQLQVAHVLAGSLRRSGDRLHVTVELMRAGSDHAQWSATYDREIRDLWAMEDDIARTVAGELKLGPAPRPRAANSRGTPDGEAHEQYLIGRELQRRGGSDDWRLSIASLRKATVLDPGYAAAFAALAYSEASVADLAADAAELQRADSDAAQAVTLAPDAPDGYAVRGYIRTFLTWEWPGAEVDLERAHALQPGDSDTLSNLAALLARLGRLPQAIGLAKRAVELDPRSTLVWVRLGRYLTANAQYAAADAAIRRALALQADNPSALVELGTLRLVEHNAPEALAAFRRIRGEDGITGVAMAQYSLGQRSASNQALVEAIARHAAGMTYEIAKVYAWRGEKDLAFEWMEQAFRQHDAGLCFLKFDPLLDALRHDPRFAALLREMNLPD